ncbi:MAG: peptidase U32 family protein [Armatimonadota bacterium]
MEYELLAPARDLECGRIAVDCGADAVYIGAPRFSAREDAGNTLDDISQLVQYAHRYWVKIYVALNTLLTDGELKQATRIAHQLAEIGVDGLIIQDMGLLMADLPDIPLIASTQMHNHTPERVAFLHDMGIQRAILARELSLDEIQAIHDKTPAMELEVFIHGALCVCYSGQCTLSYAMGGRSGNRGQCAQPCRLRYALQDDNGNELHPSAHLLSIKDLNQTSNLGDLIDAGVCSFKIEGRLKGPDYVKNVVTHYRRHLDIELEARGLKRSSSGRTQTDMLTDPSKSFNRGFTTHHIYGRTSRLANWTTPKMLGERIGEVIQCDTRGLSVRTDATLTPGDGICYVDSRGNMAGFTLNAVDGFRLTPGRFDKMPIGTVLYRNHDHLFHKQLTKAKVERLLKVNLALQGSLEALTLTISDADGICSSHRYEGPFALAEQAERAVETISRQLGKLGAANMEATDISVQLDPAPFVPMSVLNEFRRGAIEAHWQQRIEQMPKAHRGEMQTEVPYPEPRLDFRANVMNPLALEFYRIHEAEVTERAAETGLEMGNRPVMTTKYCIKHELNICPKQNPSTSIDEPLWLVDEMGSRLRLRFNCARCQMEVWTESGAQHS